MPHVTSKDGTKIAFDRSGKGIPIVVVNGAFGYREFYGDSQLVSALSNEFTIYTYDRRGRGESADTKPYTVEKEMDDVDALIDDAGGSAFVYGISSGAALALRIAARLGTSRVKKLALYEPPYGSDSEKDKGEFAAQKKRINELIRDGKRGDAAAFFLTSLGTPSEVLEGLRKSLDWALMQRVEHTLAYEFEVLTDGSIPVDIAKTVNMPALVMYGDKSFDFMKEAAEKLAKAIPNAQCKMLKDQTHQVSAEALAPVLRTFFSDEDR